MARTTQYSVAGLPLKDASPHPIPSAPRTPYRLALWTQAKASARSGFSNAAGSDKLRAKCALGAWGVSLAGTAWTRHVGRSRKCLSRRSGAPTNANVARAVTAVEKAIQAAFGNRTRLLSSDTQGLETLRIELGMERMRAKAIANRYPQYFEYKVNGVGAELHLVGSVRKTAAGMGAADKPSSQSGGQATQSFAANGSSPGGGGPAKPPGLQNLGAARWNKNYMFVDELDLIDQLSRELLEEKIIAVDLEGDLSRNGRISLIQVASSRGHVYIFDVAGVPRRGTDDFEACEPYLEGLKLLLEGDQVLKVLHDCRSDSEALQHLLGIRLSHVLDTQMAWALLHPSETRRVGLNVVLSKFAGAGCTNTLKATMSDEMDMQHAVDMLKPDEEEHASLWFQRPLPRHRLHYAAQDVSTLVDAGVKMLKSLPRASSWQLKKCCQAQLDEFRDNPSYAVDSLPVDCRRRFVFEDGGALRILSPADEAGVTEPTTCEVQAGQRGTEVTKLLAVLPVGLRQAVEPHTAGLIDIVLDCGRHPTLRRHQNGGTRELDLHTMPLVTREDLQEVCEQIEPFDAQGRSGIPGTLHRISRIHHDTSVISGLTMRFAYAANGALRLLLDVAAAGKSVLLLGPPGAGKTTLLRAFAAEISKTKAVMIVEASKEIAGSGMTCHPSVGRSRRILASGRGKQRYEAMLEAVENHTPNYLVIDEIGNREEVRAAATIGARGIKMIATAHGQTLATLLRNRDLNALAGGTQEVILASTENRYDGFNKVVQERSHEPAFDILLEVQSPLRIIVHRDLSAAVDTSLAGGSVVAELREAELSTGEMFITRAHVGGSASSF